MEDIFSYNIEDKSIVLVKPTAHTINISSNIYDKININKIELARYILYYSQRDYKEEKHTDYTFFENLEFEYLKKFFCDYINSDEELLNSNSQEEVSDIESGVELIIKHREKFGIKMSTILILGKVSMEVNDVWIDAIHGKFNQSQSEKLKDRWKKFITNIIPNLPLDNDTKKQAEDITEFLNGNADNVLKYAEIISLFINSLEFSRLWIPSRLTSRISKEFIKFEPENVNLKYLPNLIIELVDEKCLDKMKTDILGNQLLSNRSDIVNEIFNNLKKKSYHSVISLGLSQIDFLVYEIVLSFNNSLNSKYTNSKVIEMLLDKLEEIKGHTTINKFMPFDKGFEEGLRIIQFITLTDYLNNHLFKKYVFYKDINSKEELNRHGILHGKISNYGTFENAIRIIILIDDLLFIFKHYIKSNKNLYE